MAQRILVVDDEPAVTDLLTYNLRKAHYDIMIASNGIEALRLAREASLDLILLDLMIPEVDGLDVCRELRKTSGVPIIMITARGEEIDRVVGLELGADDYICKPFSVRELLARINPESEFSCSHVALTAQPTCSQRKHTSLQYQLNAETEVVCVKFLPHLPECFTSLRQSTCYVIAWERPV
jgi:DNA-binding response OmpR family regulator